MSTLSGNKHIALVAHKGAGDPTADQLAAINRYTLTELTADQVYVRTAYVAHNAIDRDREAFSDDLLKDFANSLPGKGLFIKHPRGWDGDSGPGVGRWFEASVKEMSLDEARIALREPKLMWPDSVSRALLLEASAYMPRHEKNAALLADMDAGVAGDVSIGFSASKRTSILGADKETEGDMLHGPGEALETSLVWLGAQPGARFTKSAKTGDDDMDKDEQIKTLKGEVETLKGDKAAAEQLAEENAAKAKSFDAIKAVAGDLADNAEGIKAAIEAGTEYRKTLVDQIVTAKRHLKMVGDTEDAATTAKDFYKTMPLEMLKQEAEAFAKQVPNGGTIEGGDPNTTGADDDKGGKGLRDKSVTHKAVGLSQ